MVDPAWRDELDAELTRRRLPASYIERLVQELCDHHEDVLRESMSMDAEPQARVAERLGTPENLAAAAATTYWQKHVSLRRGLVTYALLPVLVVLAFWMGLMAIAGLAVELFGLSDVSGSLEVAHLLNLGVIVLPFAASSVLFGWLARRNRTDWCWPLLTTWLLAILAGMMFYTVMPWGPAREPRLVMMVGLPGRLQQVFHWLVILTVGGWSCWRVRQRPLAV